MQTRMSKDQESTDLGHVARCLPVENPFHERGRRTKIQETRTRARVYAHALRSNVANAQRKSLRFSYFFFSFHFFPLFNLFLSYFFLSFFFNCITLLPFQIIFRFDDGKIWKNFVTMIFYLFFFLSLLFLLFIFSFFSSFLDTFRARSRYTKH